MARAVVLAALLVSAVATGVAAAAPADTSTVWVGSAGATLRITDVSAKDGNVLVGWDEAGGSAPEGGLASSFDGGAGYQEWMAVAGYGGSRADACTSPLDHVGVIGYPGSGGHRWAVLVNGVDSRPLEDAHIAFLNADVACAGTDVVALAVLRRTSAATHLIVWLFTPDLQNGPTWFDLGPVSKNADPAIVADSGWVHLAWMSGTTLKYRRFKVGGAPSFRLSARPTVSIETAAGQSAPQLGVDGTRVVLAWQRKASVVARVSTDRGVSFDAPHTLFAGRASSAKVAYLDSADVRGTTVVVAGTVSSEGISATGSVMRTTNDGRSWANIPGTTHQEGFVFAALDGPAKTPILHVAWDERFSGLDPQTIRATSITLS